MKDENIQKIEQILDKSVQIGIVLPEKLRIDELSAGLALQSFLTNKGKTVRLFSSAVNLPDVAFMKEKPQLKSTLGLGKEFMIRIKGETSKPKQIRYEKEGDDLVIYVTPQELPILETDVELHGSSEDIELMIVIGVSNMEVLGRLYSDNPEIFYHKSKICINNQIEQEYFGVINWVDPNSSSVSEMIASWLTKSHDLQNQDAIITPLLAGIIGRTQSFRDPKTTPETLAIAANLVRLGARQQDIIQYLFKTKPFDLLQLWGRALARVRLIPEQRVLYTVLTKQDIQKSGASAEMVPEVLRELAGMASDYQLLVLGQELDEGLMLYLAGPPFVRLRRLANNINPESNNSPDFLSGNYHYIKVMAQNKSLEDIEEITTNLVNNF